MTGIIRAPRPEKDYFELRNATARDARLSYRARGILARLLSNVNGYRQTAEDLAREGKEGRGAVLTALKELRATGYMQTKKSQDAGGKWTTSTYVYDTPQPTEVGKPDSGFPNVGWPVAIKNDQKNNQQKKQQHKHAAARGKKKRRIRASGIVTWTADDVDEAEKLEASTPPEELAAAVGAFDDRNKDPVPGLVQKQLKERALRRKKEEQRRAAAAGAAKPEKSSAERARMADLHLSRLRRRRALK